MKKITAVILSFVLAVPAFVPMSAFAATTIDNLSFTGAVDGVTVGPLGPYEVTSATEHVSVEEYGSNTNWAKWESGQSSWHGFGSEDPEAVDDGSTLYALRLAVHVESNEYEISEHPSILYNGNDFTETGNTTFVKMDWGGYAYIDFGQAHENPEEMYALTFDFNGGATYDGQSTITRMMGSVGLDLSEPNLVSCFDYNAEDDECHAIDVKKGKALSYVKINGTRYEIGDDYLFNDDTTIVYYWENVPLQEYEVRDAVGNIITFEGEVGRDYQLEIESYSTNMTEAELEEAGIPVEIYEQVKAMVIEAVGENNGTVLSFLEIEVFDENFRDLHEGPFTIRLKMTDEMAGFNTYKLIYLEETEDGGMVAGETIELTIEDGYLVGTLPHLSAYALVGSNESPVVPNTGVFSKVMGAATAHPMVLASSVLILIAIVAFVKKAKKSEE